VANNGYDDLFDAWGAALNVNPQLGKTIFHVESSGDVDVKDAPDGAAGPMRIKPETAKAAAVKLGLDPNAIDLHDMRWAVPIGMQVLADGLNATQSPEGAFGYYQSGSADPAKWDKTYIAKATKSYPDMSLLPATQDVGGDIATTGASQIGQTGATINRFLRANAQGLDATKANWCAAFVNGVLNANGVAGTTGKTRDVATSFLQWGQPVQGDPQAGDVLVQPKGHAAGQTGGHVGIATGQVAEGPGGSYYLMESGNVDNKVIYSWEPAQSIVVRRMPQRQAPQSQPQTAASQ